MDQPQLVCARCEPTERRIVELEAALRSMSDQNTDLLAEVAGLQGFLSQAAKREQALKAELTTVREEGPKAKQITGILEYWKATTGHTRAGIELTEDRAKLVRGKLRTYKVSDLMEAIDGAILKPYKRYGKRYVYGNPTEVATQLEDCIGKQKFIEENRKIFLAAQESVAGHLDVLYDVHKHYSALAHAYFTLVMNLICARELEKAGKDPAELVARVKAGEAELGVAA